MYVHVPFCEQLCPYCPYNRVPYQEDLAIRYLKAVIGEIEHYSRLFPGLRVSSVYFGGGTPTVIGRDLEKIILALRRYFKITGPICLETNPADLTREKLSRLASLGVESISLGIQSFNPRLLEIIGRRYPPGKVEKVLNWLREEKFKTVNIDLMFALPGQSLEEFRSDLELAASAPANQITAYPFFAFPYSTVGRYRRLKNVKMPPLTMRRKMYFLLHDYLTGRGYHRDSVWSFKKGETAGRYSSVTRERYIGFGPGAGSYYGSLFTLNTFSVVEYISAVEEKSQAVALGMKLSPRLASIYDFYWRLYDTIIPKTGRTGGLNFRLEEVKPLYSLIRWAALLGMVEEKGEYFSLTRRGCFWLHLGQNYFFLRYVNTIWTTAMREAWPGYIKF